MRSVLKKIAGIAVIATLALGMFSCVNPGDDTASPAGPTGPAVGDFILNDGTVLSKDKTPESGKVVAILVRAAADGKPALGVGLVHDKTGRIWCENGAAGMASIDSLLGDSTSGYMDGSDGWEKLKSVCSDAQGTPGNYPAWNFCLSYATTYSLTGDLAKGWYLPTMAELYTIYKNKRTIDASLAKAGGNQFGTDSYWSCCQYDYPENASVLSFEREDVLKEIGATKSGMMTYHVCAVRAFN